MFTGIEKLTGHLPIDIYSQLLTIKEIDGPKRCSNFLGQTSHETGDWKHFTENLNYSAERLLAVFPKYFKDLETANHYARNPEKIANRVYANRLGNGDEQSGDGYKHRGFGAIQVTGKSNQEEFFRFMGLPVDTDPQLIATTYSMMSAAWFFTSRGIWSICDLGVDGLTVTKVTHKVNGGEIGLTDRIENTQHYYNLLTGTV